MKITFIDHYDSFSFNVLEWLRQAGGSELEITRITCDDLQALQLLKGNLTPLVISPGPGKPSDYPETLSVINEAIKSVPVFGICLGHQMLGEISGGRTIQGKNTWHGTKSKIHLKQRHWFTDGLPEIFEAVVYNSLVVDLGPESNQNWLDLGADQQDQLMILSHKKLPVVSVQFHPESFGSDNLIRLASNFLAKAR